MKLDVRRVNHLGYGEQSSFNTSAIAWTRLGRLEG